jgi:hypothetical protein
VGASGRCSNEEVKGEMRNLAELRLTERAGGPVDRPPPTVEIVSAFEREFNVSLPLDYLEFLKFSNGGYPGLDSLRDPDTGDLSGWYIEVFYHLSDDQTDSNSLWLSMRNCRWMLEGNHIPFGIDGTGNIFILDTSTTPATVLVCDMDDNRELIKLASSFEDFINRLEIDPETSD